MAKAGGKVWRMLTLRITEVAPNTTVTRDHICTIARLEYRSYGKMIIPSFELRAVLTAGCTLLLQISTS